MILGLRAAVCVAAEQMQVLHNHLSVFNAHMLALLVHNLNREMRQDLLGPLNSNVSSREEKQMHS